MIWIRLVLFGFLTLLIALTWRYLWAGVGSIVLGLEMLLGVWNLFWVGDFLGMLVDC